jgi:hypothetical protein
MGMFITYIPWENLIGETNYSYRILVKNMKERSYARHIRIVEV